MPISDFFKINEYKKQIQELKQQVQELENSITSTNTQLEEVQKELFRTKTEASKLSSDLCKRDNFIKSRLPLFELSRLELPTSSEYLKRLWNNTWSSDIHASETQLERQSRACASNYTPLDLSPENASGHFHGLETKYCTTLTMCDCVDFQRRLLPCKHMYRLAYEFDVFMLGNVEYNLNVSQLLYLDELKTRIKNLSSQSSEILSDLKYYSVIVVSRSSATQLIASELVVISDNKQYLLDKFKRDELYNLLPENATIKKSAKKSQLIEYILSDCSEIVSDIERLTVAIELSPSVLHLQSYIGRFL